LKGLTDPYATILGLKKCSIIKKNFLFPVPLYFFHSFSLFLTAMPPASTAGDHGPMATSQHSDNRPQTNTSQAAEQAQQQNMSESHTSPSPSAKKGSFFKKNVEDGMDR